MRMREITGRQARALVLGVGLAVVLLDQWTKSWAESALDASRPQALIGSFLQLHLTHNAGAAFSFLTGKTWVFTLIATLVSGFLVWKSATIKFRGWAIAVGLLLGGALGNWVDRLTNPPAFAMGRVVDFIELPYWPVFNVADMGVVVGASVLVLLSLGGYEWSGRHEGSAHV